MILQLKAAAFMASAPENPLNQQRASVGRTGGPRGGGGCKRKRRRKRRGREDKGEKTTTSDTHCDERKVKTKKKIKRGRTGRHHICREPLGHVVSTYLLHGHMKSPQHFPKSFKFFSASFMSWLIWFMPSSTRSSCSGQDKGMTAVE